MPDSPRFEKAFPYQNDLSTLPVVDLDLAAKWYGEHFGMKEVERLDSPDPTVILERDDVRIGFAINGGDASQEGAAILVTGLDEIKKEIESAGLKLGDIGNDERDGKKLRNFFVVAPDGLCYYFHEIVE